MTSKPFRTHVLVRSSSGDDLYDVVGVSAQGRMSLTCTCQAGLNGLACKHRLALIAGDASGVGEVVDGCVEDFTTFRGDTPVGRRLVELERLESEQAVLKKKISAAKKALGRELDETEV